MYSSSNCRIDPSSPSFPLSASFFSHENLLFPQNPNFFQDSFSNFEPISVGPNVKHFNSSYENDLSGEKPKKKKKNDTPRKINTARGLRERRVRLSLNVAQKFFNLQDLLGFDKASKTLDWLLGKSNLAIEELKRVNDHYVISNCCCEKSAYCTCECENLLDQTNKDSKISELNNGLTRSKVSKKYSSQVTGRESRTRARERARKRTKEKMGATRACDRIHLGSTCPIPDQIEAPKYSETMTTNGSINIQDSYFKVCQEQRTFAIEDSVLIDKNLMKPFSVLNAMSSSIDYLNWEDIGGLTPQPFVYVQNSTLESQNFKNR